MFLLVFHGFILCLCLCYSAFALSFGAKHLPWPTSLPLSEARVEAWSGVLAPTSQEKPGIGVPLLERELMFEMKAVEVLGFFSKSSWNETYRDEALEDFLEDFEVAIATSAPAESGKKSCGPRVMPPTQPEPGKPPQRLQDPLNDRPIKEVPLPPAQLLTADTFYDKKLGWDSLGCSMRQVQKTNKD